MQRPETEFAQNVEIHASAFSHFLETFIEILKPVRTDNDKYLKECSLINADLEKQML
jgi:hypothetical protein